ncbi:GNAT family N-acetyltransferase [Streptomyces sp. NBC_01537]|uniref:GNAT family N-acetyltransferase n=1 Tax=Streptomyces sp. NBC_01537 TaxID=2903896 RepID=UPI0038704D57
MNRRVRLRGLSRWQAEHLREDLADLYVESCATASGWEHRGRKDFLHRLAGDLRHPGFAMLVAESPALESPALESPALVGFASGFPVRRDGDWWSGFRSVLPQEVGQFATSGRVFAITGMVVHPTVRNRGLAGRLQERLFADQRASLGATLVGRANRAACAGFRSWGWRDIGVVYRPPGPTVLRALVLPLAERTDSTASGRAGMMSRQDHPTTDRAAGVPGDGW